MSRVTPFALVLYGVFVTALALILGFAAFTAAAAPAAPPARAWIYSPVQKLGTGQEGVIVVCQGKTNSRPFSLRKFAKPGDVLIQTCRAVRGEL